MLLELNLKTLKIDPFNSDVGQIEQEEDFHSFDDLQKFHNDQKYLITDIEPEFISPIVSFVDNKVDQKVKSEMIKAYDTYYTRSRKDELAKIDEFRKERVRSAIKGKVVQSLEDFHEDILSKASCISC